MRYELRFLILPLIEGRKVKKKCSQSVPDMKHGSEYELCEFKHYKGILIS